MSDSNYGVKVEIYNTVLHEILKKYVEKGIFRNIGDYDTMIHLADGVIEGEDPSQACAVFVSKKASAFYNKYRPECYKDILPCLLLFFKHELGLPKEQYEDLKEGLLSQRRKIEHAYDHVLWETSFQSVGGDYDPHIGVISRTTQFFYDRFSDLSCIREETKRSGFLDEDFYGFEKVSQYDDKLDYDK